VIGFGAMRASAARQLALAALLCGVAALVGDVYLY
jgi:hypothetical protein